MLKTQMSTLLRVFALSLAGCLVMTACARRAEDSAQRARAVSGGETAELDARRAITVDASTRLAVLTEMRQMLKAVQGIVGGAASGDTAAIRAAASSAGTRAASEASAAVQQQLGADFVQLGMRTHMAFDSLADGLGRGTTAPAVLGRLATIMGNCVGCHEQWRLTVR